MCGTRDQRIDPERRIRLGVNPGIRAASRQALLFYLDAGD
jgi:hypothetical protein